jgi:hypothetical protein
MRRALALLVAVGVLAVGPLGVASAASPRAPGCEVASADLTWGFKESFRAYIDGSIANGEWTTADGATYHTPSFGFPAGTGKIDPVAFTGDVAFGGSVRYTGHGGVLETTIANPVIRLDGVDRATLLLDVSGPTMAGDAFTATAVPFVEIDLSAGGVLTRQGDVVLIDGAPAVLTEAGSEAFPNYEAGTAFDPVTVEITVDDDCDLALGGGLIGVATPLPVLGALLGALLAGAAIVIVVLARRRR